MRELGDDKGDLSMTDGRVSEPHDRPGAPVEELIRLAASELEFDGDVAIGAFRDADASLPELIYLKEVESQLWKHFSAATPTLGERFPHAQRIAWAWVAVAHRQAHAAFLLSDKGFPDATCANARAAVEHGVYLSLLAAVESVDSVLDPLEAKYLHNAERVLAGVEEELPEFLARMVEDIAGPLATSRDRNIEVFERVCDRLETGNEVYRHYRKLSSDVHAGFGSAAPFFLAAFGDRDPSKPILSNEPVAVHTQASLWLALGGCAWAGWSADRLFEAEYFGPLLDSTVRDMDFLPLVLKPAPENDR